jgi:monooxygenase
MLSYQLSRRRPNLMRRLYRWAATRYLPEEYVDTHFKPPYDPWDQRVCLVPDGDLFASIAAGDASVVTDRIDTFTERGIRLASGEELEADLVVTATGLQLLLVGGIELCVDGEVVEPASRLSYKGLAISGVPNLALAIGYTNASWTLKCELICEYVCRLLNHMDAHGYRIATPTVGDEVVETKPLLELTSGYVQRSIATFPKQGVRAPWRVYQNYLRDVRMLRYGRVDDGMAFSRGGDRAVRPPQPESLAA